MAFALDVGITAIAALASLWQVYVMKNPAAVNRAENLLGEAVSDRHPSKKNPAVPK